MHLFRYLFSVYHEYINEYIYKMINEFVFIAGSCFIKLDIVKVVVGS
jgi:hypothetical protein